MKLLSVISARSTWLFNLADLNHKGIRLFPDIIDALTDAYDFDEQPDDAPGAPGEKAAQPGIKFVNGRFQTAVGPMRVSLELYNDGIIADTSASTDVSNAFLEHVLQWSVETFDLAFDPIFVRQKLCASEVAIQLTPRLSDALKPLGRFAEILSTTSFNVPPQAYFPGGISFTNVNAVAPFSIDVRVNTPADANIFYSKAATDTRTHLELLKKFEELLLSPSA